MTVPAAIKELEKIESVKLSNGKYMLDHAVTRNQKTILSSFGLTEIDVRAKAVEIRKMLESVTDNETADETNNCDKEEDDNNGTC